MANDLTKQILESGWDEDANGKRWEDYETIVCPDGQVIDMVKLIDDQYRAMAALTHLAPMFGGFISKLRFVYTFKVSTQATDCFNIFVNPQFTYNLDLTGKTFVMAHELMHCLLNHMRRGKGLDHQKSNIAADYEVNITLVDIKLFKEETINKIGGLIDKKYKNLGFEKIYDMISSSGSSSMSNSKQSQQAQKQSGNRSGGQSSQQQFSDDYKAGWEQAIKDYEAGKIKI